MPTKPNNAAARNFALKRVRDKSFSKSFRKAAYQDYKASGGTLTFTAASKPKKKR